MLENSDYARLELGCKGERFVYNLFDVAGREPVLGAGPGDILLADGLSIEVKASLPGSTGRYQFCLYRERDGVVKTDATRSDVTILLAFASYDAKPVVFVIPSSRLCGIKNIKLPRNLNVYAGKWSWFRGFDRAIREVQENVGGIDG